MNRIAGQMKLMELKHEFRRIGFDRSTADATIERRLFVAWADELDNVMEETICTIPPDRKSRMKRFRVAAEYFLIILAALFLTPVVLNLLNRWVRFLDTLFK
jgi:hypothetical protein